MNTDALQKREVFHLSALRALVRSVPGDTLALKGGTNLRFFFGSIRYSEDMDLDTRKIAVHVLREKVMSFLQSRTLVDTLRTYGIARIVPPDLRHAKQTETVQRFKVHLITTAGEDLSTKIEFSRRGFSGDARAESVSAVITATYQMPPLIVPHYVGAAAVQQKITALLSRPEPQARDVFDLYILSGRPEAREPAHWKLTRSQLREARERVLAMEYDQYRDTVVAFLGPDDMPSFDSPEVWDEIRLKVVSLLEKMPSHDT
ncbi:MAG: nucleotidyl transferase AbiEii/AbiGii toxin family protein [Armatimonadetes bacterium]|nr:nucleotidyl transferase AbiEii/AbiGii toxin family protein [Armatimonadota bacterium]MBI2248080.1 nucleotidyl transferase AbiEii/AbiGii toxin family protein [Armatimonadota bacterium]MBI2972257.1 nucleotidyl transferase AbiEii/AbiGii toxin family protein [Armatimonadota bacterium]